MKTEEIQQFLDRLVEQASEVTDAVQLLATWQEGATTNHYANGTGNWYARRGLAQELIERDQALTQNAATKEDDDD